MEKYHYLCLDNVYVFEWLSRGHLHTPFLSNRLQAVGISMTKGAKLGTRLTKEANPYSTSRVYLEPPGPTMSTDEGRGRWDRGVISTKILSIG